MTLRRRLLPWIASSLLLAAACDRGASAPAPETPAIGEERGRVVIVGIDGATLRVIEPMMARGSLPQLAALAAEGVSGPLRSFQKITSPRIWNSVVTGKRPEKHGITGFATETGDGGLRLLLSSDRRAHALWNIASDAGQKVAIVNFWNTYPPELVDGVMVSDHILAREIEGRRAISGAAEAPPAALIHPDSWSERIASTRRAAPVARGADPFLGNEALASWMDREQLSRRFEEDDALMRMALEIEAEIRPDLLLLLLPGIDRISHFLWGSLEAQERYPEVLRQTPAEQRAGRAALEAYYAYTDELLAALLRRYGDDDLVIVLSDHGFEAGGGLGILTGVHESEAALDGVVFMRGPGVPVRGRSEGMSVLDVTPTVLAWWGLPIARDMDGKVAPFFEGRQTLEERQTLGRQPIATIASYDTKPVERATREASGLERTIVEQLRMLGYIDGEKRFMRAADDGDAASSEAPPPAPDPSMAGPDAEG